MVGFVACGQVVFKRRSMENSDPGFTENRLQTLVEVSLWHLVVHFFDLPGVPGRGSLWGYLVHLTIMTTLPGVLMTISG